MSRPPRIDPSPAVLDRAALDAIRALGASNDQLANLPVAERLPRQIFLTGTNHHANRIDCRM